MKTDKTERDQRVPFSVICSGMGVRLLLALVLLLGLWLATLFVVA